MCLFLIRAASVCICVGVRVLLLKLSVRMHFGCVSLQNCVCVPFNADGWDVKRGFRQSGSHPDQCALVCV